LAIVCGGAPESELCTDPVQSQTFVMAMTMVRAISMGAPLFGTKQEFVNALQGKGMVGQIFAALQLKPVTFKDPKGVAVGLSVESKMFSIYADGVVPGYRKETRVRLHAVVDFRTAQPIGQAMQGIGGQPQQQQPPANAPANGQRPTTGQDPANNV